jgi:hypothetical protein
MRAARLTAFFVVYAGYLAAPGRSLFLRWCGSDTPIARHATSLRKAEAC